MRSKGKTSPGRTDQNPTDNDQPTTRRAAAKKPADVVSRLPDETEPNPATPTPTDAERLGTTDQNASRAHPDRKPNRRPLPSTIADERDDVLGVINELVEQLDRHEDTRKRLEHELTEAHQQLEWQTVTLQTRVEALEQISQEVALLEAEIADSNTRAQRLSEQLTRAEKDNIRITTELKSATRQLEELWSIRKERDGLRGDLKNTSAKLDQLERAHKELQEDRGNLQLEFQGTEIALDEARVAKQELTVNLRTAEDRISELQSVFDETRQKLEAARNEKKSTQVQLTRVERENARLAEQHQFYECELTSLRSTNRNAQAALADVKKAFSEVHVVLAETKTRARRRALETLPHTAGPRWRGAQASVADPDAETVGAGGADRRAD
jgi:chromosome segregation ATPase